MGLGRLEALHDPARTRTLTRTRTLARTRARARTRAPTVALALAVDLGGVAQAVARGGLARGLRDDDAHAAEAAHDREGVLVRHVVADVHGEDVLGGS